jgi:hypothetical protein
VVGRHPPTRTFQRTLSWHLTAAIPPSPKAMAQFLARNSMTAKYARPKQASTAAERFPSLNQKAVPTRP